MSDRIHHPDLVNPTVGDVIAFLSTLDATTSFCIEDPDTNWAISLINVYESEGAVWFTGTYGNFDGQAGE